MSQAQTIRALLEIARLRLLYTRPESYRREQDYRRAKTIRERHVAILEEKAARLSEGER